jgi:transposase
MTAVRCVRLKDSAFGSYYHRLLARGMKPRAALVTVMRKMLLVAYRLLQHTPSPNILATEGA